MQGFVVIDYLGRAAEAIDALSGYSTAAMWENSC
jgi:hypothetical protein